MSIKFTKITRVNQRNLKAGEKLDEHGITFDRLANGDGRYKINIMVDGQRIHRVVGKLQFTFAEAAKKYLAKLEEEGGKIW